MLRLVGTKIKASSYIASSTAALVTASVLYQKHQQKQQFSTYSFVTNSNVTQCSSDNAYLNDKSSTSYNVNNINQKEETIDETVDVINDKNADKSLKKYCDTIISNTMSTKRIIPTMEALGRAIRLVQTITLIVFDYEIDKHRLFFEAISPSNNETFQQMKNLILQNGNRQDGTNDNNTTSQIEYWEKEINERTKKLENAQYEYTKDPAEEIQMLKNENKSQDEISEYRKKVRIIFLR